MTNKFWIRVLIIALVTGHSYAESAETILLETGIKGGLIVHLGLKQA